MLWLPMLGIFFCAQALDARSRDPYYSAAVIEADSGRVLWEDHASAEIYPASVVKLMTVFVVLDDVAKLPLKISDIYRKITS